MQDEAPPTGSPEIPVIEFAHPMPGFPGATRFALVRLDDEGVLCALRSLDDPDLRFLVVPPMAFFPDYAPVVADDVADDLELRQPEDALVLLVVRAAETLEESTANLAAPIVVNTATRRAVQAVLDDPGFPVAAPLVA